jgi:NAD(P)-dependent dehydrogenase (short-subunit alcohol dehydrogenase family)
MTAPIGPDLAGRVVVVVGASAGIGRESARWFARHGARVLAVGRRSDRLEELAASEDFVVPLSVCAVDVTTTEGPAAVAAAAASLGPVDLLLHAAGASPLTELAETDAEVMATTFATNAVAPSQVCRALLDQFAPGAIAAFMSSESVGRPRRGLVTYSASKAALEEMVRGWRVEHPTIRFCSVCVGATIGTDFSREFGAELLGDALVEWIRTGQLSERQMDPAEVGETVAQILAVAMVQPGVDVTSFAVQPPGPLASM